MRALSSLNSFFIKRKIFEIVISAHFNAYSHQFSLIESLIWLVSSSNTFLHGQSRIWFTASTKLKIWINFTFLRKYCIFRTLHSFYFAITILFRPIKFFSLLVVVEVWLIEKKWSFEELLSRSRSFLVFVRFAKRFFPVRQTIQNRKNKVLHKLQNTKRIHYRVKVRQISIFL